MRGSFILKVHPREPILGKSKKEVEIQQVLCLGVAAPSGPSRSPAQLISHPSTWLLMQGQRSGVHGPWGVSSVSLDTTDIPAWCMSHRPFQSICACGGGQMTGPRGGLCVSCRHFAVPPRRENGPFGGLAHGTCQSVWSGLAHRFKEVRGLSAWKSC